MPAFKELIGQSFGRWVVDEYSGSSKWLCTCACGTKSVISTSHLRSGASLSCGCYQKEVSSASNVTHGRSRTTEYRAWTNMIDRCFNQNSRSYPRYGGRGISVCDEWKKSFSEFFYDMGEKPTPAHSIDRIDNDGDYTEDNCRWATHKEQSSNRADNRLIEFNSECKTLYQWAADTGINANTIRGRLRMGWPIEKAITQRSQRDK